MNYHNILPCDMVNGEGLRVVLFVSGCEHQCKGCQNPQTWSCNSGITFDDDALEEVLDCLSDESIAGITLTGGDPLLESNLSTIRDVVCAIRHKYSTTKTIWLYTGYTHSELTSEQLEVVNMCDVLVDEKYIKELHSPDKEWVGSSNQNVIRL